ncbi:M48 family metalloprotease [Methylophilus aquaticus]|uniref:M48 family metalloprotease n=1 Tax=Methylophilus aquaticus TaxID=1971610 RepID=A0ABT9JP20_9PROT|nr:M48 family metalloprotease [Methylophilus aquaticus]MDP8566323.1 M48 family metalloprotease [Methylophilus aquaticus]
MNELVYPRERTLGKITLVLGLLVWIGLIVGTFGVALLILGLSFLLYLFAQSALIAYIKGNGVELTEAQLPDLYAQFVACCDRLQMESRPEAFILNGNGGLNAFATKFLGTQYVVLLSDIVDAMEKHTDGVKFYIGHELGHLRMKHLGVGHLLRWPALWLPLVGAAYSRARESTCDRHGLACSESPESATRALVALSTGPDRWNQLDLGAYLGQAKHTSGFWMSFHELIAGYPWLTKRAVRIMKSETEVPKRNGFAYLIALFIPFAGRLGGGFGLLIMVYMIGVLAAIAIPAYQDYTVKAKLSTVVIESKNARRALTEYYQANQKTPESLDMLGIKSQQSDGSQLSMNPNNMELTVRTKQGQLIFKPSLDDRGNVIWGCTNGEGIKPTQLPPACHGVLE